jgi:hypothetical protein
VRETAVKLLCRIFSQSDALDGSHRSLCSALIGRLNDPQATIRVIVLQHVRALYAKLHDFRADINGIAHVRSVSH